MPRRVCASFTMAPASITRLIVKVQLPFDGVLRNARTPQVGSKRTGQVGRHIEQGLTREGLAPLRDTACIELLGIPGARKRVEVFDHLGRERVKAGLAILGPRR